MVLLRLFRRSLLVIMSLAITCQLLAQDDVHAKAFKGGGFNIGVGLGPRIYTGSMSDVDGFAWDFGVILSGSYNRMFLTTDIVWGVGFLNKSLTDHGVTLHKGDRYKMPTFDILFGARLDVGNGMYIQPGIGGSVGVMMYRSVDWCLDDDYELSYDVSDEYCDFHAVSRFKPAISVEVGRQFFHDMADGSFGYTSLGVRATVRQMRMELRDDTFSGLSYSLSLVANVGMSRTRHR